MEKYFFLDFKWRPRKKGLHQKWKIFSPNSSQDQKNKRSSPNKKTFFFKKLFQTSPSAQMQL